MWSKLSKILRVRNLCVGIYWSISWKNVILYFLYWPIALINILKMEHFLTAWKKLMSLRFLKKDDLLDKQNYRPVSILPLLSKVFEKLIYKQLSNYIEFFEFYTLWFSKHAEYPTCFIQVTSFLAKRVSKKRICGYNFNGFVESIWLYTTRSSNSQIGMLWNW